MDHEVRPCNTDRCPTAAQDEPVRKGCPPHLAYATSAWKKHVALRKRIGGCINCPVKGMRWALPGELRCAAHKEKNRLKCLAWTTAHPDKQRASWEARKGWIALGRCPVCRPHRKLRPGSTRCQKCQSLNRARHAGAKSARPLKRYSDAERRIEIEKLKATGYRPRGWRLPS